MLKLQKQGFQAERSEGEANENLFQVVAAAAKMCWLEEKIHKQLILKAKEIVGRDL